MRSVNKGELILGLAFLVFALIVLFVWIPLDTDTGLIEKVRRRLVIGDALAPSVAAVAIALGALLLVLAAFRPGNASEVALSWGNLGFLGATLGLISVSFLLMRWLGPLAVALAGDGTSYRALRDTLPWKYLGYEVGGFVLILASVVGVERRLRWRSIWLALIAPLVIAMIYDLPFDDLLLPPNGDL